MFNVLLNSTFRAVIYRVKNVMREKISCSVGQIYYIPLVCVRYGQERIMLQCFCIASRVRRFCNNVSNMHLGTMKVVSLCCIDGNVNRGRIVELRC